MELDSTYPHGRSRGGEIVGDLDTVACDRIEEPGRLCHELGEIEVCRMSMPRHGVFAQLLRHARGAQRGVADGVELLAQTQGISGLGDQLHRVIRPLEDRP